MSCCKSFINCLPVLSILSLLSWSYYAYVFEFCLYTVKSLVKQLFYLIIIHTLFLMVLWSYFRVLCSDISIVPSEFKIPQSLYEKIRICETEQQRNYYVLEFCQAKHLTVITRTEAGYIRICSKCKHVKPDRAHHCSTCRTCVLRMDHHCPWVNNCVGFSNYKYFLLFLAYCALYCLFYFGTALEYCIKFMEEHFNQSSQLHIMIATCFAASMTIFLLSFLCYHFGLVLKNCTTLESMREPTFRNENMSFNVGSFNNFVEVFGENSCLWFLPLSTTMGDGIIYPVQLTLV